MKIPKMIIFDYGHTLVYEEKWDGVKAYKALFEHIVSNKNNFTAGQIDGFANDLFTEGRRLSPYTEIHEHIFFKLLCEYLQIEINLPLVKIEEIYWDNAAPANPMPNIKETLEYLRKNNIRTGVISNIAFSGEALKNRIDSVLPENNFEFIIASSEYIFRKPNKFIFELALRKADLPASEVWYCGDSVEFDVTGANSVGIFPVLYESEIECWYREKGKQSAPDFEYLHIKDWLEAIDKLEGLK